MKILKNIWKSPYTASILRADAFSILKTIVVESKLDLQSAVNNPIWDIAEQKVEDFLSSSEDMSDVIYLPDGSGVVRVCLTKQENAVEVLHVDCVPDGAPEKFVVTLR